MKSLRVSRRSIREEAKRLYPTFDTEKVDIQGKRRMVEPIPETQQTFLAAKNHSGTKGPS
jgi:hypothetical protein